MSEQKPRSRSEAQNNPETYSRARILFAKNYIFKNEKENSGSPALALSWSKSLTSQSRSMVRVVRGAESISCQSHSGVRVVKEAETFSGHNCSVVSRSAVRVIQWSES